MSFKNKIDYENSPIPSITIDKAIELIRKQYEKVLDPKVIFGKFDEADLWQILDCLELEQKKLNDFKIYLNKEIEFNTVPMWNMYDYNKYRKVVSEEILNGTDRDWETI